MRCSDIYLCPLRKLTFLTTSLAYGGAETQLVCLAYLIDPQADLTTNVSRLAVDVTSRWVPHLRRQDHFHPQWY